MTLRKNKELVGTEQIVLVEGFGKKSQRSVQDAGELIERRTQYYGRTTTNRIVNFERENLPAQMSDYLTGRLVRVRIEKAYAHSLWGIPLAVEKTPAAVKGANSYAA